jgi:c-di-GMP-binding flagellar brake protein YcgR
MSRIEKRKQGRFSIDRQLQGQLFIRTTEGRYLVIAVNDISTAGVSVVIENRVAARSKIAVEYSDPSVKLEVHGIATWCSPQSGDDVGKTGGYDLGVELFSPLFFYSLVHHP